MRMVTPYDFLQFLKVRITDNFAITRRSYCEGVKSVAIAKMFHQQISQLVLRRSINVEIAPIWSLSNKDGDGYENVI